MKEELEKKLNDTIEYHSKVLKEISQLEEKVLELKKAEQQLIGRAQTYQELIQDQKSDEDSIESEELVANKQESDSE